MKQILNIFLFALIFTGCMQDQSQVKSLLQTNNANRITEDFAYILKALDAYYKKLNARNPNQSEVDFAYRLQEQINAGKNELFLLWNKKYLQDPNLYLKLALDPQMESKRRNDYLVLGMYKYIWQTYQRQKAHHVTAFGYDAEAFKELYYTLNVLNWKIKTQKDSAGSYLFLTWQNNWQIQLHKKLRSNENPTWDDIQSLPALARNKETLFSPSNHNFEVLLRLMLHRIEHSMKIIGEEPLDVSLEVMKKFVFFL